MSSPVYKPLPETVTADRIVSADQGAELYGISVATYRRLHRAGRIPAAIRISDRRLGWRLGDLLAHLKNKKSTAAGAGE